MTKYYFISVLLLIFCSCSKNKDDVTYRNSKLSVEERVKDLVGRMTIEEKIAQMRHIHGFSIQNNGELDTVKLRELTADRSMGFVEAITLPGDQCLDFMTKVQRYMVENTRLGIPIFTVTESLHGSVHDGATIFPQAIALGSTFNPDLAYQMSSAIAKELNALGIHQSLTPVIDVVRDLRWGRVEECFSEDPFLVSEMGINQVKGYLNNKISPMIKHFGAHASPTGGLNLSSVACGQRELLSIYLKPFEEVVKEAKPWAVMSSYNSWNNEPNSSSKYLLTDLLRNQWGFQGYVYSDWGAIGMLNYFHRTATSRAEAALQAVMAGLDAEASDNSYEALNSLVENGLLDVKYIDQSVSRILRAKFAMGLFENPYPNKNAFKDIHNQEHISLAKLIADESIVLMKNEDNILPLNIEKVKSIALIGPNADQVQFGDYTWTRDNKDGITLRSALHSKIGDKVKINYARGCDIVSDNKTGFEAALEASRKSDVSIIVVGSASASLARDYSNATCGEGFDLSDLTLTGVQEELIRTIHSVGKPVIVVLLAGKPFAIPWVKENIKGILVQWYPGEQGGNALADVILGSVNPSGKLNISFPQSVGHLPCYYNYLPTDKGFYKKPGKPNQPGKDYVFSSPASLWAFGHGLSYSQFEYLSAETSKEDYMFNDSIELTVNLKNNTAIDGKEVVQVYVRDMYSSVVTPIQELKGFQKVMVKAGETVKARITIPVKKLALINSSYQAVVEPGAFEMQIGGASDDIQIKKIITVERGKEVSLNIGENKKANLKSQTLSTSVEVSGVVRDVQANLLSGIKVRIKKNEVITDNKGFYTIKGMSNDTLFVSGYNYVEESILINGHQTINISLKNK